VEMIKLVFTLATIGVYAVWINEMWSYGLMTISCFAIAVFDLREAVRIERDQPT
jgi:hypothetical protein